MALCYNIAMKKKIFITRTIPDAGMKLLKTKKNFEVKVWHDKRDVYGSGPAIPYKNLLKEIKGADAILCMLTEKIDEGVFKAAGSQLKVIAQNAVGYNNIDIKAAKKYGVTITNTPGVLSRAVAEHTIALIMAISKRIVEADRYTRAGKYKSWAPLMMLTTELSGKTLGLVGGGRIGSATARFAHHGLGMKILYADVVKNKQLEKDVSAKRVNLLNLCKRSDVVSVHVPLLPSTKYLIGTKELAAMKETAFLVNTARGPIVKEIALLRALKKKQIAGAALDVFECEPLIDCNVKDHMALRDMENVILTPHIASAAKETRDEMAKIAAKNIIAVLGGRKPLNPVI